MSRRNLRIGFTGTRLGMSEEQRLLLKWKFEHILNSRDIEEFHHGDCIGADAQAAEMAKKLGIRTIAHPAAGARARGLRANHQSNLILRPRPYMVRNHDIVLECDLLIAAPRSNEEELRSGTWATVRFARQCGTEVYLLTARTAREYNGNDRRTD